MTSDHTADHTAIVTGANHGIGAATAEALARRGCAVLCTYLRVADPEDPGIPRTFRDNRARDAAAVIARIEGNGGTAVAVEADLSDPATTNRAKPDSHVKRASANPVPDASAHEPDPKETTQPGCPLGLDTMHRLAAHSHPKNQDKSSRTQARTFRDEDSET